MDGWITIGTKLSTDKFDKQVTNLERKIEKEENKSIDIEAKIVSNKEKIDDFNDLIAKSEQYKQKISELQNAQNISIKQKGLVDPKISEQLKETIKDYRSMQSEIDKNKDKMFKLVDITKSLIRENRLVKKTISDYKDEINNIKANKLKHEFEQTKKQANGIKDSIGSTIKKVGKLALGVFGLRSAYMFVRQAVSTLSGENQQLSNNITNIKSALANTMLPIIEKIIGLVKTLMAYVNYFWKVLFGKNLFKSGADNLASGAKSAKEIKKSLAGFDEMNVVSDTNSSSSGGGVGAADFNKELEDIPIPDWLDKLAKGLKPIVEWFQKIIEKYGPVAVGIGIVVAAIAGFFILKSIKDLFKETGKATAGVSADFTGFLNSLGKAAEAIAILGGLALVISSVTDLITAFSESGLSLGEVAGLLGIVLGELAGAFIILMGAMTLLQPSWQSIAAAAVILAGLALVIHEVTGLIDALSNSGMSMGEVFGSLAGVLLLVVGIIAALTAAAIILGTNPMVLLAVVAVTAALVAILFTLKETLPTILDACSKFINDIAPFVILLIRTITESVNETLRVLGIVLPPILNATGNIFEKIFTGIERIVTSVGGIIIGIIDAIGNAFNGTFEGIRRIIQQTGDTTTQVLSSIIWFINALGPAINNFVDNLSRAITKSVNLVVSAVEYIINTALGAINKVVSSVNLVPGINLKTIPNVYIPRFQPRLATGGIINMPNKGVMLGGAIGGESGAEGVIPLTDSQAMETLGEAIGKYVVINLTNINQLNGRIIGREIKKINAQQDFAYNT